MNKELLTLEYDKILDIVSGYAASERGKSAVLGLRPSKGLADAEENLARTNEAYTALRKHNLNPVSSFDSAPGIFDKAARYSVLSCGELLKAARLLRVSRLFRASVEGVKDGALPYLNGLAASVAVYKTIESLITDNISDENEVSDRASAALRSIRSKIRNCNRDIKDKLNNYIKSPAYSKYLQDNIITVRGNRFCLSVKSECRGQVPGLVHDQSSSGATLFIEPMQVVELNNQLKILAAEENAETERVLKEYTAEIGKHAAEFKINEEVLAEADMLFSKAQYALTVKAVRPKLNGRGYFRFKAARHPLIAGDKVVPIDIELGGGYSILIITGPNTGGKTVTLKTAGLLNLMAASGLFVPAAEGAEAAVFSDIFCDIGDEQSIAQNLSTFSGHITNIVRITGSLSGAPLVLLDELGAGTDPYEGAALAVGIIKYLVKSGARAIITTHYSELKGLAAAGAGIQNASMQFDTETLLPTYRLRTGIAGTSCAMEVARHLGLNEEILAFALENADKLKLSYDKVLKDAEKSILVIDRERAEVSVLRVKLEKEYAEIAGEREKLSAAREKLNQNTRAEVKRLAAGAYEKAESIINEMKELLNAPEDGALFRMGALKNRLKDIEELNEETEIEKAAAKAIVPAAAGDIKPGATVIIKPLKTRAVIASVNDKKGEAEVKMGGITMIVPFSDIGKEDK